MTNKPAVTKAFQTRPATGSFLDRPATESYIDRSFERIVFLLGKRTQKDRAKPR
jgi:hypothetical protein